MRLCTSPGCGKKHAAKGYCIGHYQRMINGKPTDTPLRGKHDERECEIEWCWKKHYSKGYCRPHYAKLKYGSDVDTLHQDMFVKFCKTTKCHAPVHSNSYCNKCFQRVRNGVPLHDPEGMVLMARAAEKRGISRQRLHQLIKAKRIQPESVRLGSFVFVDPNYTVVPARSRLASSRFDS